MRVRNLIIKFVVFSILLTSTYFFALWQVAQGGQIDYFYNKFTHQAGSMIIGISRANDGISPSVIEQNFKKDEIDYPVLNFAFANQISDYGPVYLNAIKKKLIPGTKKGLFILEVDPAAFSILKSQADSVRSIQEDQSFLSSIHKFNRDPNFEYIRKMYNHSLYKGFQKNRRIDIIRYSHLDGWQEVMAKSGSHMVSMEETQKWKDKKIGEAKYMMEFVKRSEARLYYLDKTINYLKDFGTVFLVRVPVSKEFLEIEQSFWPDFNDQIENIANKNQVTYFDYSKKGDSYDFYDGSHMFGHSAKDFTQQLCNDIKSFHSFTK